MTIKFKTICLINLLSLAFVRISCTERMGNIPVVDEAVRGVLSVGDVVTGNADRVADRWRNWDDDSVLGTAGQTIGLTVAAGATAVVGQTDVAGKLIKKAGSSVEKLGATSISAVYSVGGIGAQVLTLGIPNPVSGGLNEAAAGVKKVIDEHAKDGKDGIDWIEYGKEGYIGLAKGAASFGGLIPYTGKLFERKLREDTGEVLGHEHEIDHAEEWGKWGLNLGLSLATAGAAKGTGNLVEAGKIGVKRAVGIAGAAGAVQGVGAGYISNKIHSGATRRKIEADGYRFVETRCDLKGRSYAVYSKDGEKDVLIPLPDFGELVSQGLLRGTMGALTTGMKASGIKEKQAKQEQLLYDQTGLSLKEIKTLPKDSMEYQAYREVQQGKMKMPVDVGGGGAFAKWKAEGGNTKNMNAKTGSTVSVTPSSKSLKAFENRARNAIYKELQTDGKWVKISSQSAVSTKHAGKAMNILRKNNEVLFLDHAHPESGMGVFDNATGVYSLANVLSKTKGDPLENIGLLGCEVTPEFAQKLANQMRIPVSTLPPITDSFLHFNDGDNVFRYGTVHNFHFGTGPKFQFMDNGNMQYMTTHIQGRAQEILKAMTTQYNPQ